MPGTFREPALAGSFYPAEASVLAAMVEGFLTPSSEIKKPPKALIVPHAGYIYSGAVAGRAYAAYRDSAASIDNVVLLGPAHRVGFMGVAVPTVDYFSTPLGLYPLHRPLLDQLIYNKQVVASDQAHQLEHSLEIQVPFMQRLWPQARLLPLLVGQADTAQVAQLVEQLWGDERTVVVISTDLSHFHHEAGARWRDHNTLLRLLACAQDVQGEEACGARALNGFLAVADRRGMRLELQAQAHSGQVSGQQHSVVGYASLAAYDDNLPSRQLALAALKLARFAIDGAFGGPTELALPPLAPLQQPGASFVTLNLNGHLRGCIGSLQPHRPLWQDIRDNAHAAAFADRRFPSLSVEQWPQVSVEVSLLGPTSVLEAATEDEALAQLVVGQDGLIFSAEGRHSTFLPQVWDSLGQPQQFLARLKEKAGFSADYWSDSVQLQRYRVEKYSEQHYGRQTNR